MVPHTHIQISNTISMPHNTLHSEDNSKNDTTSISHSFNFTSLDILSVSLDSPENR